MSAFGLSPKEASNVKAAARFLHARMGDWRAVAKALHVSKATCIRAPSPILAFRLARLVGVPVDDLLSGKYPPADVCPHCGQRKEVEAAAE